MHWGFYYLVLPWISYFTLTYQLQDKIITEYKQQLQNMQKFTNAHESNSIYIKIRGGLYTFEHIYHILMINSNNL